VTVRGRDLAGAANTTTGSAVLRIGNGCWSDTTPCGAHGATVLCRGNRDLDPLARLNLPG
jgi:hypothetical protein